jgi:hypothetical protein
MEVTKSTSNMDFGVIIKLSEKEARALEAITGYGVKSFLEVFYKHLGSSDLKHYEEGVIQLFETLKIELPWHLNKFDRIRKI